MIYRAGFAAERSEYVVTYDNGKGLQQIQFSATDKVTAGANKKQWLAAHAEYEILGEERVVYPEPPENAIQALQTQLSSIVHEAGTKYGAALYLTGKGNFRDKLATIAPYKGNRDKLHRPVHYQLLRDYLVDKHRAQIIDGMEADDMISILARRGRSIVATIDKDLDQIPGKHYDYLKHVHYEVTPEQAERWFWQQVLSGDATDNIGGIWKCGPVKASKMVATWYDEGFTQANIWEEVVNEYGASQSKLGCPYADYRPEAAALEVARLVYMLHEENELWNPPTA